MDADLSDPPGGPREPPAEAEPWWDRLDLAAALVVGLALVGAMLQWLL